MPVNFQKISAVNIVEAANKKFMTDAEKAAIAELGNVSTLNTGTDAGNVPVLNADGKLSGSILPDLAVTEVFVVASQSEMLALSQAKTGDIAIRTDTSETFILSTTNYGTLSDWKLILTPKDTVTIVNGGYF
jgi:hypothetical protein